MVVEVYPRRRCLGLWISEIYWIFRCFQRTWLQEGLEAIEW